MNAKYVDERLKKWEGRLEWPLTAVSILFLVAYAAPIMAPNISDSAKGWCNLVVNVTWGVFAVEYFFRLAIAKKRWQFFKTHLLDFAIVTLPLLRPLRLLRLITLLAVLNRLGTGGTLRGRVGIYVVGGTTLLLLCSSLAIAEAEMHIPESSINSFGDGLWWSITTMTTVGYGDIAPATTTGKAVGVALMLGALGLLGVVTATLASWLVGSVTGNEEQTPISQTQVVGPGTAPEAGTTQAEQLALLVTEVQALRAEVAELRRA